MFSQMLICILIIGSYLSSYAQQHTHYDYSGEIKFCDFGYTSSSSDSLEIWKPQYGEPPVWPDDWRRFNHEERKKAVLEAWKNVLGYLADCYPDIIIDRYSPERTNWPRPLIYRPSVEYSKVQKDPDVAAAIEKKGRYDQWDEHHDVQFIIVGQVSGNVATVKYCFKTNEYMWRGAMNNPRITRAKSFTRIYHSEEKEEIFGARIVVYPIVFERGYFFMRGETYTEEGPWAKSLMEALEYILLHELGHYESYVTTHSKTIRNLRKMDDSEKACDQFGSSVLRCNDKSQ